MDTYLDLPQLRAQLRELKRQIDALSVDAKGQKKRLALWNEYSRLADRARVLAAHHEVDNGGSEP